MLALRELLRLSYEQIGRVMGIDAAAGAPLLARSPLSHEDDEWLLAHLAGCANCEMAHAAMLEASVCYRAWP